MTPESSLSVVVLPAPLGPKKGDELALLDRQVDAAHRVDFAILSVEQSADRSQQPFLLLIDAIGLRQAFDFDDGHVAGL